MIINLMRRSLPPSFPSQLPVVNSAARSARGLRSYLLLSLIVIGGILLSPFRIAVECGGVEEVIIIGGLQGQLEGVPKLPAVAVPGREGGSFWCLGSILVSNALWGRGKFSLEYEKRQKEVVF